MKDYIVRENVGQESLESSVVRQNFFDAMDEATENLCRNQFRMVTVPRKIYQDDIKEEYEIDDFKQHTTIFDKITEFQAKREMKATEDESISCELGLKRALAADISEEGKKGYKKRQFYNLLSNIELTIQTGNYDEEILRDLCHKIDSLNLNDAINDASYDNCKNLLKNIRHHLVDRLFDLKVEKITEYQNQKTR